MNIFETERERGREGKRGRVGGREGGEREREKEKEREMEREKEKERETKTERETYPAQKLHFSFPQISRLFEVFHCLLVELICILGRGSCLLCSFLTL